MEVEGLIVHLQLKPVDVVVLQRLVDQGKAFLPHLLVHEIETGITLVIRIHTRLGADLQMGIVKTEIGAAHIVCAIGAALLHKKRRIECESLLVGSLADDAQRIVAGFDEGLRVLIGAAKNGVGPAFDIVTPQLTHLRIVEDRAAVAQTEHDGIHRGPGKLIDGGFVLLLLHGRLVHVDEGVPTIMKEHDLRAIRHLLHSSLRLASAICSRRACSMRNLLLPVT